MIDLGTGTHAGTLPRTTLTVDELDLLLVRLGIDELPIVLNQTPRFDTKAARDAAFGAAAESLESRGLLDGDAVNAVLAHRLRVLNRPHWVVALRLFVGDTVSRLCLAKGHDAVVCALRGPDAYVVTDAGTDLAGIVVAALSATSPLEFGGFSAPTAQLAAVFDNAADVASSSRRLAEIASPARESHVVAAAMVHCYAHAEIVGVSYGDGTREQHIDHIAVFDTRDGRFVATSSVAADGTKWSALSSGTDARIRQVVDTLVAALPERPEFTAAAAAV